MNAPYDLVVLGGGIVGAGVARDAALRGLRVAMFDKDDWGAGTSSKSSKLIHGGLRYLEHGELRLVFESVSERRVQTLVAPHLVRPLPFLVPIYEGNRPGLEVMNLGLWIYDSLAMFRAPGLHRTLRGRRAATALEPGLRPDGLRGAIEYFDCGTDDARLVLENVLDARALGARCDSHTEVIELTRDDAGRIRGVVVHDRLRGTTEAIACAAVVVAAGAWTDETMGRLALATPRPLLRRTKGVHLVVPHERLPVGRAITLMSPVDGRVFFVIPWRERTVIGTTDTDFDGTADDVHADAEDARYLCESINGYFPTARLSPADVIATWAGLRPLIRAPDADDADESAVSREHEIFARPDGALVIAGGKLTTYRRMAKEAVDVAIRWLQDRAEGAGSERLGDLPRCTTKHRPLPGAVGLVTPDLPGVAAIGRALLDDAGLDPDTATHLCGVYGARAPALAAAIVADRRGAARLVPDLPYVWAEIDFAVEHDLALTVTDVLARRVPLLLVARDQGLEVVEAVAGRLAQRLAWDDARRTAEIAAFRAEVAASRRFRA